MSSAVMLAGCLKQSPAASCLLIGILQIIVECKTDWFLRLKEEWSMTRILPESGLQAELLRDLGPVWTDPRTGFVQGSVLLNISELEEDIGYIPMMFMTPDGEGRVLWA